MQKSVLSATEVTYGQGKEKTELIIGKRFKFKIDPDLHKRIGLFVGHDMLLKREAAIKIVRLIGMFNAVSNSLGERSRK